MSVGFRFSCIVKSVFEIGMMGFFFSFLFFSEQTVGLVGDGVFMFHCLVCAMSVAM